MLDRIMIVMRSTKYTATNHTEVHESGKLVEATTSLALPNLEPGRKRVIRNISIRMLQPAQSRDF